MRVEPELPDHPKFLRLKKRVGEGACENLIRIWGHCQNSQRGGLWRGADREYVEVVARWAGEPGLFYQAAVESGFLDETKAGVVIHDWDKFNSKARAAWHNGRFGGRPHKEPNFAGEEVGLTQVKPTGNPLETHTKPESESVSESVSKRKGEEEKGAARDESSSRLRAREERELRTRWAALTSRIKELERKDERLPKELSELQELKKKRAEVQEKQRKGI